MSFDSGTLAAWDSAAEIEIETSRGEGAPVHRTVIWIVVDGDTAYVRSVRGEKGRWYRQLTANPHGAVAASGKRVPAKASSKAEATTMALVSELLRNKYQQRWPGPAGAMLRDDGRSTTLRLAPDA